MNYLRTLVLVTVALVVFIGPADSELRGPGSQLPKVLRDVGPRLAAYGIDYSASALPERDLLRPTLTMLQTFPGDIERAKEFPTYIDEFDPRPFALLALRMTDLDRTTTFDGISVREAWRNSLSLGSRAERVFVAFASEEVEQAMMIVRELRALGYIAAAYRINAKDRAQLPYAVRDLKKLVESADVLLVLDSENARQKPAIHWEALVSKRFPYRNGLDFLVKPKPQPINPRSRQIRVPNIRRPR